MSTKIKLALVVESTASGVLRHVFDLIENLDTDRYDIYLLYNDKRADGVFYAELSLVKTKATLIKISTMKRSIGISNLISAFKIRKVFKKIQPDIVHCHSSIGGICGRLAAYKSDVKGVIYTPHAYSFENSKISKLKKNLYIGVEKILSQFFTDVTINVSKSERKCALKNDLDKNPDKFIVIHNGIEEKDYPKQDTIKVELGLDQNIRYIGATTRCDLQKDPLSFLEIAKTVVKKIDNVEFIYIGDGELFHKMEVWIEEKNLDNKIHLSGFQHEASYFVGAFDIYLSTALYEGLPYSIIEALRAGVPVIATDVTGNNELIEDGVNGRLFQPGDTEKACSMIVEQITQNIIKREDVKKSFDEDYSIKSMIRKTDELYENIYNHTFA